MLDQSLEKIKNFTISTQIYEHWKLIAFIIVTTGYFIYYNYLSLMGMPFISVNVPLITAIGIVNMGFLGLFLLTIIFEKMSLTKRYSFLIIYIFLISNFDTSYNLLLTDMFPLAVAAFFALVPKEDISYIREKNSLLFFVFATAYICTFIFILLFISVYYFFLFLLIILLHIIYIIIFKFNKNTTNKKELMFFFLIFSAIAISISFSSIIYKQGLAILDLNSNLVTYNLDSKTYTRDLVYQDARYLFVINKKDNMTIEVNKSKVGSEIKYHKKTKSPTVYKFLNSQI